MKAINKSEGLTQSERLLARLGERNFLGLWSWPNVQYCRFGKPPKEVADLLVVCDKHIIIFSDKHVEYPNTGDESLDWRRWYGRAVRSSAKQVVKAQRYLSQPDRLFLDAKGEHELPVTLPSEAEMIVHGVLVARGVSERCRRHFGGGRGSLVIRPSVKGDDHLKLDVGEAGVFVIGDVNPAGPFIHVLDDGCLDIVLNEINTITDLVEYLAEKETFVRSGHLEQADSEEALVGYYMRYMKPSGGHGFIRPDGKEFEPEDLVVVDDNVWDEYAARPERLAKLSADRSSDIWDSLISRFADNVLTGTIDDNGQKLDFSHHEQALRYMALEPRYKRRSFGQSIIEALNKIGPEQRFARTIVSGSSDPNSETGYVFFQLPYNPSRSSYEEYRKERTIHLYAYGLGAYLEYKHLKRVVCIGTEPLKLLESPGSSEDLVFLEPMGRTSELIEEMEYWKKELNVLKPGRVKVTERREDEFPVIREQVKFTSPKPYSRKVMTGGYENPYRDIGRNDSCPCGSGMKFKKCCLR